jgi:hypothetical protein
LFSGVGMVYGDPRAEERFILRFSLEVFTFIQSKAIGDFFFLP